jgi:hypothetical protein
MSIRACRDARRTSELRHLFLATAKAYGYYNVTIISGHLSVSAPASHRDSCDVGLAVDRVVNAVKIRTSNTKQ